MKIIILSPNVDTVFTPEQKKQLQDAGQVTYVSKPQSLIDIPELMSEGEKILAFDPDFSEWIVKNDEIEKIPDLKAICLQTTSFSWIDTDFANSKDIPITNLRGFSSVAVAEWATMMMLSLARKLPIIIKDNWQQDYSKHKGIELRGKTAGIIGVGNIGKTIAANCQGLGMNVQYWSKTSRDKDLTYVELTELMKTSDIIFPVVAQNKDTQGMITDDMLQSMKKTAIFISVIHNVYNHQLLLDMVKNGNAYGYGFEDPKARIGDFEGNVWAGPELAWCTEDSMRKNAVQWVASIISATKGDFPTKVN